MINRIIHAVAGIFILASVALAYFVDLNFIWIAVFVGVNLLQSSITNWCLLEDILKKFFPNLSGSCSIEK